MRAPHRARFTPHTRTDLSPAREEQPVRTTLWGSEHRRLLLIEPATEDVDVVAWAKENRELLDRSTIEQGAMVFRGFELDVETFGRFADATCPDLFELGRRFTDVSTYHPSKKLLWHNDGNVDHSRWPAKIALYCRKPAESGGETTIADGRKILHALDPAIRKRFEDKKLLYVRNYWETLGHSWRRDFDVQSLDEMSAYCQANDMEFRWLGDRLRLRWLRPAIRIHPRTRERVWFNLLFLWHPARFAEDERQAMTESFHEEDLPDNCYYGDGSRIEKKIVEELMAIHEEFKISFCWQTNDIFMFDNMLFVHARNPFVGEREVKLAMRQPICRREVEGLSSC